MPVQQQMHFQYNKDRVYSNKQCSTYSATLTNELQGDILIPNQ